MASVTKVRSVKSGESTVKPIPVMGGTVLRYKIQIHSLQVNKKSDQNCSLSQLQHILRMGQQRR